MGTKYTRYHAGEWRAPQRKGYKLACCDCGLVHRLDFKLVRRGAGRIIAFRAYRDNRATAALRREDRKRRGE